jgi:hypothetical protein
MLRVQALVHQKEPILAEIGGITQHEGDVVSYDQITADGIRIVSEDFQEGRSEFSIPFKEIPTLMGEKLDVKLNEIADDVARQQSQLLQAKLDSVTREVGNAFDAGGAPLNKEMHLQMMENVEMNFDPRTGQPQMIFWGSAKMIQAIQEAMEEWKKDPEFVRKSKEIMSRKYEDWRDRESRRKLVD